MASSEKSYDDLEGEIWFDRTFLPWVDARVHVCTHALHYATAVFEGIRAYCGKIFEVQAHTARLFHSARALDMALPFTEQEIVQATQETFERRNLRDAYIRPIAWRGSQRMGVSAKDCKVHVAIAVWNWPNYYDSKLLENGLNLQFSTYRRPDPMTIPCDSKAAGLYMICTISRDRATRAGFDDALMLDYRGRIAESTGANIFFVRDGVLHTPVADCFLDGITRRTVIRLAQESGIEVVERAILPEELSSFSACFLTGTAVEVMPVGRIGDIAYAVDDVTRSLRAKYLALVKS